MVNTDEHTVSSPYYPRNYTPNLHCSVTLSTEEGFTILLQVTHLQMQAKQRAKCGDYLKISDTADESPRICGSFNQHVGINKTNEVISHLSSIYLDYNRGGGGFSNNIWEFGTLIVAMTNL